MVKPVGVFLTYLTLLILLIGACVISLHKKSDKIIDRKEAEGSLKAFIVTTVILVCLRILLEGFYEAVKVSTLVRCKANQMIGYGCILVVLGLAKTASLMTSKNQFDEFSTHNWFITFIVSVCILCYFLFAASVVKHCITNEIKNKTLYLILDFLNVAILIFSLFIVFKITEPGSRSQIFNGLIQLELFPLCLISCREFFGAMNGSLVLKVEAKLEDVIVIGSTLNVVEMKETKENNKEQGKGKEELKKGKEELRPECNVCLIEYSDVRIPRLLRECGHTVCQECAETLLQNSSGQHIFCPFCERVTLVNGCVAALPKNYETMSAMEWKKRNGN